MSYLLGRRAASSDENLGDRRWAGRLLRGALWAAVRSSTQELKLCWSAWDTLAVQAGDQWGVAAVVVWHGVGSVEVQSDSQQAWDAVGNSVEVLAVLGRIAWSVLLAAWMHIP